MAKGKNKDHVSFWFWFFALFVTALPCIGWVMIIVWAFTGQNESRKNYYRAVLAWFVIMAGITSALAAFGFWPLIEKQVETWMQGNGNIEHPTSNIQHRTSNIEHPTSNIQHRTSNIEHPTSNIQHRTSNIQGEVRNV